MDKYIPGSVDVGSNYRCGSHTSIQFYSTSRQEQGGYVFIYFNGDSWKLPPEGEHAIGRTATKPEGSDSDGWIR
jgi:hypothetical protein